MFGRVVLFIIVVFLLLVMLIILLYDCRWFGRMLRVVVRMCWAVGCLGVAWLVFRLLSGVVASVLRF